MKAMVINNFGGPEVFEEANLPTPYAGDGEVVIKIKASSVNPVDYKIRAGRIPFLAPSHPTILHSDAAGTITEVGAGVVGFSVGDSVMSFATGLAGKPGALAQYMAADARMIAKMPGNVSFEEAAALPLVGVTSWYDFASAIFEITNTSCEVYPIETKDYPTPASRPHFSVLNKNLESI